MMAESEQQHETDRTQKLDALGEAQVRSLAKTRARRTLDIKAKKSKTKETHEPPEAEEAKIPVQRVGWVDVPGTFLLEWSANPWQARPKKLAMLAALYIGLFFFAYWMAPQDTLLLIIVPIILLGSASSHLLPSSYIITEEGIYWKNYLNMMFKSWLDIEGYLFNDEVGELFFDTSSVRNRIQRCIPVYYRQNRDEVEELVRKLHAAKWDQLREEVRQRRDEA